MPGIEYHVEKHKKGYKAVLASDLRAQNRLLQINVILDNYVHDC